VELTQQDKDLAVAACRQVQRDTVNILLTGKAAYIDNVIKSMNERGKEVFGKESMTLVAEARLRIIFEEAIDAIIGNPDDHLVSETGKGLITMRVTRKSMLSGNSTTRDILCTQLQMDNFLKGMHVQTAFPQLSADEREFILSGITPEEWAKAFPPEKEARDKSTNLLITNKH